MKTIRLLHLFSFVAVALYFCGPPVVQAQEQPPRWVFRIDARPPSEIFANGFSPWGTDMYLMAHVAGEPDPNRPGQPPQRSGFVATAETRSAVNTFMLRLFRRMRIYRNRPLFLYRIRATPNMYSVRRYLESFRDNPAARPEDRARAAVLLALYGNFEEWAAAGRIAPDQIQAVTTFTWDSEHGQAIQGITVVNDAFQEADTQANADAYPLYPPEQPMPPLIDRILNHLPRNGAMMGVILPLFECFRPNPDQALSRSESQSKDVSPDGSCENPYAIPFSSLRTYVDSNMVTILVPNLLNPAAPFIKNTEFR